MVWDHGVAGSNPVLPTVAFTKPASVAGFVVLGIRVSNWVFKIMGYKNSDSTKAFTFSEINII